MPFSPTHSWNLDLSWSTEKFMFQPPKNSFPRSHIITYFYKNHQQNNLIHITISWLWTPKLWIINNNISYHQQHQLNLISPQINNNNSTSTCHNSSFVHKSQTTHIYISWTCNFINNNSNIIKFIYLNISSKQDHEF
jgi:hypothetical protein